VASKFRVDSTAIAAVIQQIEGIPNYLTRQDAKDLSKDVVKQMKRMISKGQSTVKGGGFGGRMPKYKNRKRYPGKRKPARPVNLELTGKQLKALKGRSLNIGGENIAVVQYNTTDAVDKETGHREGVNGQPKRPTLPDTDSGEEFAASINKIIVKKMDAAMKRYIKKTTK